MSDTPSKGSDTTSLRAIMKYSFVLLAAAVAAALPSGPKAPKPDADGRYTLTAPGIKAQVFPRLVCCFPKKCLTFFSSFLMARP